MVLVHPFEFGIKMKNEIEFGMVDPSWISLPLDSGTRKVLTEGYKIIIDKKHYCQNLPL